MIIVLCTNDRSLLTEALEAVKQSHPEQLTQELETFLNQLAKQRKDFAPAQQATNDDGAQAARDSQPA